LWRSSHDRSVYLYTSSYVSIRKVNRLFRIVEVEGRQVCILEDFVGDACERVEVQVARGERDQLVVVEIHIFHHHVRYAEQVKV
jgi:hypothetical protein